MTALALRETFEPFIPETVELSAPVRVTGGDVMAHARLAGPAGAPAIIALGGVSAGRRLLADEQGEGWWPGVAGLDAALDPGQARLLGVDFLAEACSPYPSVEDQAAAVLAAADAAGFDRFRIVGASYGGVVAMAVALAAPERVGALDILCAAARPHPMASAWRSIQRDIIALAQAAGLPETGVDIARRLAMTTYRTPEEFAERFSSLDEVERYLGACGARHAARTSPQRALALSRSLDAADLAVEAIRCPTRFLGVTSDRLVPPDDIAATAARISGAACTFIESRYGHDGFLKEVEAVNAFLTA